MRILTILVLTVVIIAAIDAKGGGGKRDDNGNELNEATGSYPATQDVNTEEPKLQAENEENQNENLGMLKKRVIY